MVRWRDRDPRLMRGAFDRALELLDLILEDPCWRTRLSEIAVRGSCSARPCWTVGGNTGPASRIWIATSSLSR